MVKIGDKILYFPRPQFGGYMHLDGSPLHGTVRDVVSPRCVSVTVIDAKGSTVEVPDPMQLVGIGDTVPSREYCVMATGG
jgi:hypothetical protein